MEAGGAGCSPRQKWSHLLKVPECAWPPAETQEQPKAAWPLDRSCWPSQRGAALGLSSCRALASPLAPDVVEQGCCRGDGWCCWVQALSVVAAQGFTADGVSCLSMAKRLAGSGTCRPQLRGGCSPSAESSGARSEELGAHREANAAEYAAWWWLYGKEHVTCR